jgi:hypothetical protein
MLPTEAQHSHERETQAPAPGAGVDRELEVAEMFPMLEHGRAALDTYGYLTGEIEASHYAGGRDVPRIEGPEEGVKQYYLYDIPDGQGGDRYTIREAYATGSASSFDKELLRTPEHVVGAVAQGHMRVIDRRQQPYLRLGMSECSALIAVQPNKLWVAHLSYSSVAAGEQVADMMQRAGVTSDQLYAVASLGDYQDRQAAASQGDMARRLRAEDYARLGVPAEHTVRFDWSVDQQDPTVTHNMVQVLACNSGVYVQAADYRYTKRGGWPRDEKLAVTAEQALEWPPPALT